MEIKQLSHQADWTVCGPFVLKIGSYIMTSLESFSTSSTTTARLKGLIKYWVLPVLNPLMSIWLNEYPPGKEYCWPELAAKCISNQSSSPVLPPSLSLLICVLLQILVGNTYCLVSTFDVLGRKIYPFFRYVNRLLSPAVAQCLNCLRPSK